MSYPYSSTLQLEAALSGSTRKQTHQPAPLAIPLVRLEPARSLSAVQEAWQLVYRRYVRAGLILSNPWRIHTVPQAVRPGTLVLRMLISDRLVGTLTVMADGPGGLPLDSVYAAELTGLRRQNRQLVEVGLFAEEYLPPALSFARLDLMRWAFYGGIYLGATDLVIGVHPRHARFYRRMIGFQTLADVRAYPTVRFHPVVPLRLNIAAALQRQPRPKALEYFAAHPLAPENLADFYRFPPDARTPSDIASFLKAPAPAPTCSLYNPCSSGSLKD